MFGQEGFINMLLFVETMVFLKLFVNGIEDSDFTTPYTTSLAQVATGGSKASQGAEPRGLIGARIADGSVTGNGYRGYIQDFRLTKGVSRYSSNFTPPTEPLLG